MEDVRHDMIMDRLDRIEDKHIGIIDAYVVIDKGFVMDVIVYTCFVVVVIGLGMKLI